MTMASNSPSSLLQHRYTNAEVEGIVRSAKHTIVESDSTPGTISHLVVSTQGNPEWKERGEIWLRSKLELLPGYPSDFSTQLTVPSEQTLYPVFFNSKFAGR
jgi:hypothetical protein